jgi:tyrosinase
LPDWEERKAQVGGPDTMWAYPYNVTGVDVPYKNITLDFELVFANISSTVTISQVMDIANMTLGSYLYE